MPKHIIEIPKELNFDVSDEKTAQQRDGNDKATMHDVMVEAIKIGLDIMKSRHQK